MPEVLSRRRVGCPSASSVLPRELANDNHVGGCEEIARLRRDLEAEREARIRTDSRNAELEQCLREAEAVRQTFDAVMECIPVGITIASGPDVRIQQISRFGQQLLGPYWERLSDLPINDRVERWLLLRPDGTPPGSDEEPVSRVMRTGETLLDEEWMLQRPGGERMLTLCNTGPIRDERGEIRGAVFAWRDITQRKRLQEEEQQREMARGLLDAHEEERRAVAYDLHDGLTQYVMASYAHLESSLAARQQSDTGRADQELELALDCLSDATLESRRVINGLRTLMLEEMGLAGAVERFLQEEKRRAGWEETEFQHNIEGRRFEETVETAIYRIAQEALANARKYAGARKVAISLLISKGTDGRPQLELNVRDWGRGFVPDQSQAAGVGLHSMRDRATVLGGEFVLRSQPGEGTLIRAVVPVLEPR